MNTSKAREQESAFEPIGHFRPHDSDKQDAMNPVLNKKLAEAIKLSTNNWSRGVSPPNIPVVNA